MRSHRRWCVFFNATFSTLISLTATAAHAQLASPPSLDYNVGSQTSSTGVGPAYYEAGAASQFPTTGNVRPVAFNQFSNPGGPMQATNVQQNAPSRLRDSTGNNTSPNPNVGYGMPGAYRNTSMQQPGYPSGPGTYPPAAPFPNQNQGQMTGQFPGAAADQMQGQLPPAQLRSAPATGAMTNQQQPYQQQPYQPQPNQQAGSQPQVVSGDRRFVMPPPVGNYPTTPYRPPFRTVAYQLPQQSPTAQPVQPPSQLANQAQVLPNTTNLPQYQSTVGQMASYQALQPGYNCAPGIPTNGVPAFVPGAVAPPTLPPNLTPQLYSQDNSGYTPLFSLGQENYNVQLGRGIIGQPTVYVSGQPIRNFLRYLSP